MKNEGLLTIVVIHEFFMEHEKEKVEELLHLLAQALGTGLTSKMVSESGWFEYAIEPMEYQVQAVKALQDAAFTNNPNEGKELSK